MELLERLCTLLEAVEFHGKWPEALALGLVAPLPKGEGLGPGDIRPITITSVVYRLWAAVRVQELISWQETWLDSAICSYRPEKGCEDIWVSQAISVEYALIFDEPLAGFNADLAKAFDRIPVHVLLSLAEELGADADIIRALRAMYAQLQRRYS